MKRIYWLIWFALLWVMPLWACALARQTPQPGPELQQLAFEIQTATPTSPPLLALAGVPTYTPDPNVTPTPAITTTLTITGSQIATAALATEVTPTTVATPTTPPTPTPTTPLAQPVRGGEWDFEGGFEPWTNPFGDGCPGSGLAIGWSAFTTRDQFGSSCFNQTTWQDNVYSGDSAQEITFAYVGNEAGVFKTTSTTPGHRYTIEAFMRREFSPAKVELALGVDVTGGQNWQAESVQWFIWNEDFDNQWSRTEQTVTAASESMTIFIKGFHPYPEPGGAVRLDSISVVDLGPLK